MSELVRLDGKHTAQTAHFAVLKKSSRHPWPHGRGILQFSTHLLAKARWAWAPPCSWWWGRLRWWRLPPWCYWMGWPPDAAACRRSKAHLHISLAPPALMVIERTSICFWFAPHLRYCCLSILTPPSPPVHQNISSKIGYVDEALLVLNTRTHLRAFPLSIWLIAPPNMLNEHCSCGQFHRVIFFEILSPSSPIMGHNWKNDLTRLCFRESQFFILLDRDEEYKDRMVDDTSSRLLLPSKANLT